MTRRSKETSGCIVRKTPKGIVPVSGFDQELLMADAPGTEYKLVKLTKRSLPQQRTYWKALSLVAANDDRWASAEALHDALKRACGIVTVVHDLKGNPFITTDSTAFDAMDADAFKAFMDKAMAQLAEAIGWDPLSFLEERAA